jgi:hypothetical protein
MGGAIGVSALGAAIGTRIADLLPQRLAEIGVQLPPGVGSARQLPDMRTLPDAVRIAVESSYSDGIAEAFLIATPIAIIALVAVAFMKEIPLRTNTTSEELAAQAASESGSSDDFAEASVVTRRARETADALAGVDPDAHDRWAAAR